MQNSTLVDRTTSEDTSHIIILEHWPKKHLHHAKQEQRGWSIHQKNTCNMQNRNREGGAFTKKTPATCKTGTETVEHSPKNTSNMQNRNREGGAFTKKHMHHAKQEQRPWSIHQKTPATCETETVSVSDTRCKGSSGTHDRWFVLRSPCAIYRTLRFNY